MTRLVQHICQYVHGSVLHSTLEWLKAYVTFKIKGLDGIADISGRYYVFESTRLVLWTQTQ